MNFSASVESKCCTINIRQKHRWESVTFHEGLIQGKNECPAPDHIMASSSPELQSQWHKVVQTVDKLQFV